MFSVIVQSTEPQIIKDAQDSCRQAGLDCHPTLGPMESQEKFDQLNNDWPIAFITDSSKPLPTSLKNPERLCVLHIDPTNAAPDSFKKAESVTEISEWSLPMDSWNSTSCKIYLELAQSHLELNRVKNQFEIYRNSNEQFRVNQEHLVHESKNTLFILQGRCDKLRESLTTPKIDDPWVQELKKEVNGLAKASERLIQIGQAITQHLAKARNQSTHNTSKETLTTQNIHDLISHSFEEVSVIFSSHVVLTNEVPKNLELSVFKNKMLQVAVNLLLNSYNAIKKMEDPWIKVKAEESEHSTTLFFLDSGNGIKDSEKIFKPRYTSGQGKLSQGLGLKIARRYLNEMDAKIYYRLYEMKHTCLVVEFFKTQKP